MAYRLKRDETLPVGVRRIAYELLDEAIGLLDDPGDTSEQIEEAVHEVRKNCKKLRGLVRFVRPGMGKKKYRKANATFRDAARELASIRDAHALLDTFDDLVAAVGDRSAEVTDAFASVRQELAARADEASRAVSAGDERIARARKLLAAGRGAVEKWPLADDRDVVRKGVAKTYRRGRHRLRESMFDPTDEVLHQWRKRVKYTWYHVRLLQGAAPSVLDPLVDRFHDLSDTLGDDHDLAVLVAQLEADPEVFGGPEVVATVRGVIEEVRQDLQKRAWRLGTRLYVEPAQPFADRLTRYWKAWQKHGDEMEAGEIAGLAASAREATEAVVVAEEAAEEEAAEAVVEEAAEVIEEAAEEEEAVVEEAEVTLEEAAEAVVEEAEEILEEAAEEEAAEEEAAEAVEEEAAEVIEEAAEEEAAEAVEEAVVVEVAVSTNDVDEDERADDLDGRTMRQLYAIARELDVSGRSTMKRDALVAAIRAAQGNGG